MTESRIADDEKMKNKKTAINSSRIWLIFSASISLHRYI
jgi:hypothetical protein